MSRKLSLPTAGYSLACALAWLVVCSPAAGVDDPPAPGAKAAIRRLESRHLVLDTDLPPGDGIDALPGYFDQAFPQWCAYFDVDAAKHADWRAHARIMRAPERFRAAGLLPDDLPEFKSGYTRGPQLWLLDQASPYYRRHLLLHEGTHAFMYELVGSACPPWYFEGVAELLATHRLEDGRLVLNSFPRAADEVPKLGRIEMIEAAVAAGRLKTLDEIFAYGNQAHEHNEPYAWCWAAAAFFDGNPRYQAAFRRLAHAAGEADFSRHVAQTLGDDSRRLAQDWQAFIGSLDYGFDFRRMQVDWRPGKPLAGAEADVEVAADRGWQSSGVELPPGRYRLTATGRYQVADRPRTWPCEPGGVTIRYYRGRPLGMLLAVVHPHEGSGASNGFLKPVGVGSGAMLEIERPSTLYFRINESPGSPGRQRRLARRDNRTRVTRPSDRLPPPCG